MPRSSHSGWVPASDRPNPVGLLQEQNRTRELTWCRSARGCWSRRSPSTGAQPRSWPPTSRARPSPLRGCSSAGCASVELRGLRLPERRLLFDLNDFDETLPGPFEWDEADGGQLHHRCPQQRLHQDGHAGGDPSVGAGLPGGDGRVRPDGDDGYSGTRICPKKRSWTRSAVPRPKPPSPRRPPSRPRGPSSGSRSSLEKAHTRDSLQALSKLGEVVDGRYRIVSRRRSWSRRGTWRPSTACPRPG